MAKDQETDSLPTVLEKTRERFEAWRRTRRPGERIPERLWGSAVKCAERHGVFKTARALRLDYMGLKRRLPVGVVKTAARSATPRFLEVRAGADLRIPGCAAWVEGPSGAKLHLELRGLDAAQIGALARSFAGGGE